MTIIVSSMTTRHMGHRYSSRDCISSVQPLHVTRCAQGENSTSLRIAMGQGDSQDEVIGFVELYRLWQGRCGA